MSGVTEVCGGGGADCMFGDHPGVGGGGVD